MLEDFNRKETQRIHRKKKSSKNYHDDDKYGQNKLKKEFKRKRQNLKEQDDLDDLDDWSEYIK